MPQTFTATLWVFLGTVTSMFVLQSEVVIAVHEFMIQNATRLELKGEPKSGTTFIEIAVYAAAKVAGGVEHSKSDGRHITYETNVVPNAQGKMPGHLVEHEKFFFTEKQKHYIKDIYRFQRATECTYDINRSWNHGPWVEKRRQRVSNLTERQRQRETRPVGYSVFFLHNFQQNYLDTHLQYCAASCLLTNDLLESPACCLVAI